MSRKPLLDEDARNILRGDRGAPQPKQETGSAGITRKRAFPKVQRRKLTCYVNPEHMQLLEAERYRRKTEGLDNSDLSAIVREAIDLAAKKWADKHR